MRILNAPSDRCLSQTTLLRIAALLALLLHGSVRGLDGQARQMEPTELVGVARDYFASQFTAPVSFDPRPIRRGADVVSGVDSTDFESDTALIASRVGSARVASLRISDILADKRCTFSVGVAAPPGLASAEAIRRQNECLARGPFSTFVLGAVHVGADSRRTPPVRTAVYTESGYQVWDLVFARSAGGTWRVEQAKRVFAIAS
jgi:hypothetical protein